MIKSICVIFAIVLSTGAAFAQYGNGFGSPFNVQSGAENGKSAYASAPRPNEMRLRQSVISGGKVIGQDPDINVRLQIERTEGMNDR